MPRVNLGTIDDHLGNPLTDGLGGDLHDGTFGHLEIIPTGGSGSYEIITNGEFPTGISGWTTVESGTGSVVWQAGGFVRLFSGATVGGVGQLRQTLTVQPNTDYEIDFDFLVSSTAGGVLSIGTTAGGTDIVNSAFSAGSSHTRAFNSGSNTTLYLQFRNVNNTANIYVDVDNVSLLSPVQGGITGYAPSVELAWAQTIPAAALTVTGLAPTTELVVEVSPPVGTVDVTGLVPIPGYSNSAHPELGALTITEFAPDADVVVNQLIPADALTITGHIPTWTDISKEVVSVTPSNLYDGLTGVVVEVADLVTAGAKVYINGVEQTVTGTTTTTLTITVNRNAAQSLGAAKLCVVEAP